LFPLFLELLIPGLGVHPSRYLRVVFELAEHGRPLAEKRDHKEAKLS
jgi:hypothetical protein